jgi:hypothetical protein
MRSLKCVSDREVAKLKSSVLRTSRRNLRSYRESFARLETRINAADVLLSLDSHLIISGEGRYFTHPLTAKYDLARIIPSEYAIP